MLGDPGLIDQHFGSHSNVNLVKTKSDLKENSYEGETQSLQLNMSVSEGDLSDEGEPGDTRMDGDLRTNEDSDSDDDILIRPKSRKVSKIVDHGSDDEEVITKRPTVESDSDSDSSLKDDEVGDSNKDDLGNLSLNKDLYDDEGDDGENHSRHSNTSESEKEDEEDGDLEMSEALKKKLKKMKGAAKGKRTTSSRKSKTAAQQEIQELHSESQRLTRESRVNLPYHQPKPLSLKEILEKRRQKVADSVPLRAPIHKILAKTGVAESPYVSRKFKDRQRPRSQDTSKVLQDPSPVVTVGDKPNDCKILPDDELPDLVTDETNEEVKGQSADTALAPANTVEDNVINSSDSQVETSEGNRELTESETVDGGCKSDEAEDTSVKSTEESVTETKDIVDLDSEETTQTKCAAFKKKLLADLALPEWKSFTPKLMASSNCVIDLDADVKKHSGINALLDRAMKHSKSKGAEKKRDVEMSIVCKEKDDGDNDQLKLKTFTVTIEGEEEMDPQLQKPGAKLSKLKSALQEKMRKKREEARQKRVEAYDLDNEEGFEDEEEAELTDQSDTDAEYDEDEEEGVEGDGALMEAEGDKEVNPFIEEECEDDEDSAGGFNLHLDEEGDDGDDEAEDEELRQEKRAKFLKSAKTKSQQVSGRLGDDDDDNDDENDDDCLPASQMKSSEKVPERPFGQFSQKKEADDTDFLSPTRLHSDGDSSFEITPYQPQPSNLRPGRDSPELFSQFAKPKIPKVDSRHSTLCLPIEDSQDLLNSPSQFRNTCAPNTETFHLSLFDSDSQSQILDEDGFLKTDSDKKQKPSKRHIDLGMDDNASQEFDENELLGLCSGQFTGGTQQTQQQKKSVKKLFVDGEEHEASQENMNELLELCSGVFSDKTQAGSKQGDESRSGNKLKKRNLSDDENSNESFEMLEGGEKSDDEKNLSDSEVESEAEMNNDDDGDDDGDDEELGSDNEDEQVVRGVTKAGKIRTEFFENEAELSGSEVDSDEHDDLDDLADDLEVEEGDFDDVGTEENLRAQVEKAHLKQAFDEDKREIRLMQEMFLADGDLHSDNKRTRKFRWANIDEDMSSDLFKNTSDDEVVEEPEEETSWRVERLAREQWLAEAQEKGALEEDSQIIKLGSKVFQTKSSQRDKSLKENRSENTNGTPTHKTVFSLSQSRKGSFLTRSKEALAKISEVTKTSLNLNKAKNSRNFVFTVASPDEKKEEKPKVQRSRSMNEGPKPPQAKKPRLERSNTFNSNSIFNLM